MRYKIQVLFIILLISIIIVTIVLIVMTRYFMNSPTITTIEKEDAKTLVILLLGLDSTIDKPGRTDSIYLLLYNFKTKKLFLYNIPRDLRVRAKYDDPTMTYDKVGHLYYRKDIYAIKDAVENLVSIKIPYYVLFDFSAVTSIVDMMDGVRMYIGEDMQYVDKSANLYINIKKGTQIFDGEKAIEYLRYRSTSDGDIGRINRQMNFMYLLLEQKDTLVKMHNVKALLKILYDKIKTNFTMQDLYILSDEVTHMKKSMVYFELMLTKPLTVNEIEYLVPLNVAGGNYAQYTVKKAMEFLNSSSLNYDTKVSVEILNASPKAGMAKLLRDKLIKYGVDVLYYGNYNFSLAETQIIDRIGNMNKANHINTILRSKNVSSTINKNLGVDVTIIIGEDFNIDVLD